MFKEKRDTSNILPIVYLSIIYGHIHVATTGTFCALKCFLRSVG